MKLLLNYLGFYFGYILSFVIYGVIFPLLFSYFQSNRDESWEGIAFISLFALAYSALAIGSMILVEKILGRRANLYVSAASGISVALLIILFNLFNIFSQSIFFDVLFVVLIPTLLTFFFGKRR